MFHMNEFMDSSLLWFVTNVCISNSKALLGLVWVVVM